MHTFERVGSPLLLQVNWCWNECAVKSLQSAACTGLEGSKVHYRYVCTLWTPWTYTVFIIILCVIFVAGSSLTTMFHHWTIMWAGIIRLKSS